MGWRATTTTTKEDYKKGHVERKDILLYSLDLLLWSTRALKDNILSYKKRSIDKKELSFLVLIHQGQQDA